MFLLPTLRSYEIMYLMHFRYHHGDLKEALLQAGFQRLDQDHNEMSLRSIARDLDVSHGAPYRHFSSKEALLLELSNRVFKEFLKELQTLRFRSDLNAEQKLAKHIEWIQSYWNKHPKRCLLVSKRSLLECQDYVFEFNRMLPNELGEVFWLLLCGSFSAKSVESLDKFLRLIR